MKLLNPTDKNDLINILIAIYWDLDWYLVFFLLVNINKNI